MTAYEAMVLLGADISEEERAALITRGQDTIVKGGGTWEKVDEWGRRKMTFPINKVDEAFYHVAYFDCPPAALDEFVRVLRIADGVMRVMAYHRVPESTIEVPPQEDREERPRGRGGRGRGDRDRGR